MYVSNVKSRYRKLAKKRFCQGDLIADLNLVIGTEEHAEHTIIRTPYAIVLTQDCDLDKDFQTRTISEDDDKSIKTVLICPAYPAEQFFIGEHIAGWKMKKHSAKEAERIMKNDQQKRYHFLKGEQGLSIPDIVLDFKHFYTAPRNILYRERKNIYIATLNELFREELSQRFSFYLSRIGLPEIN